MVKPDVQVCSECLRPIHPEEQQLECERDGAVLCEACAPSHAAHMVVTCPACGAPAIPVVYGLPPVELAEAEARGELVLGGCVVEDDRPRWACAACMARW